MLQFLSSVRITVVCLLFLFILTFWGTIAEVYQGLYVAQERFFNSFFFLAAGFFPFPGAQLVLWVLFINLLCMTITKFNAYRKWSYAGMVITHLGLLLYFVAAFIVFHVAKESVVRLDQGQSTNVSNSYYQWALVYWTTPGQEKVVNIDPKYFKPGYQFPGPQGSRVQVEEYYPNSDILSSPEEGNPLIPKPLYKEREQNIPGTLLDLKTAGQDHTLILFGAQASPTAVAMAGKTYYFDLRHQQYPLPFTIRLDRFKVAFHPGTEVAKSYESWVTISRGTLQRQVRIYMNNPLRYKDYTLYQASYGTDSEGHQYTVLAVVKNFARLLPYISCFVVFFGMALHFLMQAFTSRQKI